MAYRSGSGTNISMFLQASGGSGGSNSAAFEAPFQNSALVGNDFVVNHNLGSYPSAVSVYDENGIEVTPDGVQNVSTNQVVVSLESYVPIPGNWRVSLTA